MPKYDLACTVIRDGKELTGPGIELPKETGDRLVAKKFATLSAVQTEVKAEATGGDNGGQGGSGDRYKAQHKGGGHYTVIDTETGEQAVEETMSKEEAQAVANELNAAE